jgi:DNA-directed RNA polymerase specialized sigma24 family protein
MENSAASALARMTDPDLRSLVERLTVYALRKMWKLRWRGIQYASARCGLTGTCGNGPEDLVSDVILRVIQGKRVGSCQDQAGLERLLRSAIDSRVNHHACSLENRRTNEAVVEAAARTEAPSLESRLPSQCGATPLEVVVDHEDKESFRAVARKAVAADATLAPLLECLLAGLSPAEAAEYMDVDVKEIYTARKRLDRALSKALGKLVRSQSR